jgi:hypothetical protein
MAKVYTIKPIPIIDQILFLWLFPVPVPSETLAATESWKVDLQVSQRKTYPSSWSYQSSPSSSGGIPEQEQILSSILAISPVSKSFTFIPFKRLQSRCLLVNPHTRMSENLRKLITKRIHVQPIQKTRKTLTETRKATMHLL